MSCTHNAFLSAILPIILLTNCQKEDDKEIITEQQVFNSAQPTDISFANKNVGFISGSYEVDYGTAVIAKTVDAGLSWEIMPVYFGSEAIAQIRSIYAMSKDSVYATFSAVDGHGICFSKDGGITWSRLVTFPITNSYSNLLFTAPKTGFLCGGGSIFNTKNGWTDWEEVLANRELGGIGKFFFTDSSVGYAYGALVYDDVRAGYLFKTTNGGDQWFQLDGLNDPFTCLKFINNKVGYAFTFDNNIYKTDDGALSWTLLNNITGTGESYYDAFFSSGTIYFASGASIYKTNNEFKTILKIYTSSNLNTYLSLKSTQTSGGTVFLLSSEHSVVRIKHN
jgi:photosystem II stability/assembly factor-like uncharacterized protein